MSAPRAPSDVRSSGPRRLIVAESVTKTFGRGETATHAVRGVTCEFPAGELALLMGPSGSGKTTLISILAGIMQPTSGDVSLCGTPVAGLREETVARVRRRHLGFVFQGYNLFPALTALENVAEVLVLKGMARAAAEAAAHEVLASVGLKSRVHHRPSELSGGQQQRVALARALAGSPEVIIGDEVTAALDTASAEAVMALLRRHVGPRTAVVLVTHDQRLARYADRVVAMEDGRITTDSRLSGGGAS
jgi:putative ABC transport system ATP-binding protein